MSLVNQTLGSIQRWREIFSCESLHYAFYLLFMAAKMASGVMGRLYSLAPVAR